MMGRSLSSILWPKSEHGDYTNAEGGKEQNAEGCRSGTCVGEALLLVCDAEVAEGAINERDGEN